MAIKWGSTYVTVVKWGSTICTQVKWGSTVVFPDSTGYNGSSFSWPIASGFNNSLSFNFNFKQLSENSGYLDAISNDNIDFSLYKNIYIPYTSTKPYLGNQFAWGTLDGSNGYVFAGGSKIYQTSTHNFNCSNYNDTAKLWLRPYFQYNGSGYPDLTVNLTITSIVFS